MTDSPAVRFPLDPQEQPILDGLYEVRAKLEFLKQDRSNYIKSQDVLAYYNQVLEQVGALNRIRTTKRHEQNRVDTVLDDCFQLVSLFFLTVGKNQEAPAVYSAVSTIKRLLEHLKEASFYSTKDLASLDRSLRDARESVKRGRRDNHNEHLLTLLEARIDVCDEILSDLKTQLSKLSPELSPKYEKLVSILRSLSACNTRSKFPTAEIKELHEQIKELEAGGDEFENGALNAPSKDRLAELYQVYKEYTKHEYDRENTPAGELLVQSLLERCVLWEEIIIQKQGKIDERFQDVYDKLFVVRNKLESIQMTHSWSLRETDLYSYQRQLARIDESRIADGNFLDAEGQPADIHAQRTLLYLLRKSYAIIYHLLVSSEPVSEALLPIFNQLTTLRRCLLEVKKSGGVSSPRELYPYSMKLNSIDNMRVDGKFMLGSEVPEGQGAITQLLEECFEMAYELRTDAEENESDKSDFADSGNETGSASIPEGK